MLLADPKRERLLDDPYPCWNDDRAFSPRDWHHHVRLLRTLYDIRLHLHASRSWFDDNI